MTDFLTTVAGSFVGYVLAMLAMRRIADRRQAARAPMELKGPDATEMAKAIAKNSPEMRAAIEDAINRGLRAQLKRAGKPQTAVAGAGK